MPAENIYRIWKKRRKEELKELTILTGKNIDNWQDDIAAKNEDATSAAIQYANLLPGLKKDIERENDSPTGFILYGVVLLSSVGFLKWKGMI